MFDIGTVALDKKTGGYVRILDKYELWGYRTYTVCDISSGRIYNLLQEHLVDADDKTDFDIHYFKYIISAARIKNELNRGFVSSLKEKIIPLPHQIYALNRALSKNEMRYLLADEVGLGKTIEAGLIMKELKTRGLINRILIVCPKSLMTQWYQEMKDKFDEIFYIILPRDFDTIKRLYGEGNPWLKFSKVICPLDSVKPLEKRQGWDKEKIKEYNRERFENLVFAGWDLIIIDEAHRLGGSSSDVARYKLGKALSEASPYLLLLSATPHQGKTDSFLRLMNLIDKEAFPDERAIIRSQVAPYVIRSEKREAVDENGNPLFKKRITQTVEIKWENRHSLQETLYKEVTRYVAEGYNRAIREKKNHIGFLMILMQRLVTSSTRAIKTNLERRLEILVAGEYEGPDYNLEDFWDEDAQEALDELIKAKTKDVKKEINEIKNLLILAKQTEDQYIDAKTEVLDKLLNSIMAEDPHCKILIFTEFIATQEFLKEFLEMKGFKIALLNGSMDMEERLRAIEEFRDDAQILISTDAGGEGLNLQFCHIVINYDLPWNPMKIEQRIGRVDRIGQERDVRVYNFMLSDTVEFRVRQVLEEKLRIIFEQFGVDKMSDVLDSAEAGMDFTDVYMNSIADPDFMDYSVEKIEDKIREKTKSIQKAKELLKSDKQFDASIFESIRALKNYKLESWIMTMYENWLRLYNPNKSDGRQENDYKAILEDEFTKKMLEKIPYYVTNKKIPCISINKNKGERGYWSLWEVSLNNTEKNREIFPLFINEQFVLRPASSKFIWDELLEDNTKIEFTGFRDIEEADFDKIYKIAMDVAFNYFDSMKRSHLTEYEREKERYEYAFKLKKEAAMRIGLETVRRHRLRQIEREQILKKTQLKNSLEIIPSLKPVYLVFME